ncbi:MAG: N-acetylglucosamine-6-phosphate deacetylase [Kordiimonadaceae bacterium]|nr:N-acetylglucosamine-6-phosphate deacetylase [Kordiimonadaceae bacterium]MBO6569766.1 N-acetylglucosamine-6-phosphate deacetylase [Kordiimonadaceae bacterium]MBO6966301.1 N-acetylglucosamine-6-phosphate deacetylase [Kordiimonadaceae bacterium]
MSINQIAAEQVLVAGQFLEAAAVRFQEGRIVEVSPTGASGDLFEGTLVPGFFDVQVNGGGGALFNDDPSVDTLKIISDAHRKFGTSRMLPTLISDDLEKVEASIKAVDTAITEGVPGIMGIHLEGPFLNTAKKGVHDAKKLQKITLSHVPLLSSLKNGRTLLTLAPELADGEVVQALLDAGVILSAGHTAATYEQMKQAVDWGVSGFTHLFNAMTGFESRAPGVVGAAFDSPDTFAGVIADGHHVHPASLKHAIQTMGPARTMLVTDAMPTVGAVDERFELYGETIVAEGGRCATKEGVLAGSDLDMASAVRYAAETLGFGIMHAVEMASRTPARFMGFDADFGTLAPGQRADMVLLDKNLNVSAVWVDGNRLI